MNRYIRCQLDRVHRNSHHSPLSTSRVERTEDNPRETLFAPNKSRFIDRPAGNQMAKD